MDNALLIGNGINRLTKGEYGWEDFLKKLIGKFCDGHVVHEKDNPKPFPLLYEEIVSHALLKNPEAEKEIKEFMKENLVQINPNEGHGLIREVIHRRKINNILTTNYDYIIEQTVDGTEGEKPKQDAGETKYSLCRRKLIKNGNCSIWHIHGELNHPDAIVLGHEHYGDTLSKMDDIISTGRKTINLPLERLNNRIFDEVIYTWVDFFFKYNIHIIGLNLYFSEIDLWWLLVYRVRQKARAFSQDNERKLNFEIQNKIYFYYPSYTNPDGTEKNKLEILNNLGVTLVPIELHEDDYQRFYKELFESELRI